MFLLAEAQAPLPMHGPVCHLSTVETGKTRCMGRALYSCELRQITTLIVTNGISGNIENA